MRSTQVGAGVVAAGVLVLVVGVFSLNRSDAPLQLAAPAANSVTPPTDADGREVEIPPSQPAGVVSFGADGTILRPDPVRARMVDRETGAEVLVALPPSTTVDAVTGAIIPRPPGGPGWTTVTTGRTTTPTSRPGTAGPTSTTAPPTTDPPPTTEPPTTTEPPPTTEPATTTTGPPATDPTPPVSGSG